MPATVREQIDEHAAARGGEAFVISPENKPENKPDNKPGDEKELTFRQLKAGVDELGARLDQLGIKAGAKVAFLLDNGVWAVRLFLGIMASGRVVVPLNAVAGPAQLQHVLDHSDTEAVFVAPHYRDKLNELLARVEREITVIATDQEHGPHWPLAAPADCADQTTAPARAGTGG